MVVCLWIKQTKPNSTKANQKPFILSVCPNRLSKPNQTFSTIISKLTASNEIKSKVPERHARAAQLLYRPVLVEISLGVAIIHRQIIITLPTVIPSHCHITVTLPRCYAVCPAQLSRCLLHLQAVFVRRRAATNRINRGGRRPAGSCSSCTQQVGTSGTMVAIIFLVTTASNLYFIFYNFILFKGIAGLLVCFSSGNPGKYGNMEKHIIATFLPFTRRTWRLRWRQWRTRLRPSSLRSRGMQRWVV